MRSTQWRPTVGGRRSAATRSTGSTGHRTGCPGGSGRRRLQPLAGGCCAQLALVPAAAPGTAPQADPGRRSARGPLCGGATRSGEVHRPGPVRDTGLILTPVSVMARAIPADSAADDLAAIFDAALHARGCHEAGSTPVLWYVNLVYFTCPVHAADELAAWTEARQQMKVTDVRV